MPETKTYTGGCHCGEVRFEVTTDLTIGPARIHFTDRHGGVSATPYASANLGTHVGDDADAVAENRRRLGSAIGGAVDGWVWLQQVHGNGVVVVDAASGVPAVWRVSPSRVRVAASS